MVFRLFKRRDDKELRKKVDNLHNSIDSSFQNLKQDIVNVSKWIRHFENKHSKHEDKFNIVLKRLEDIENTIEKTYLEAEQIIEKEKEAEEVSEIKESAWENLTEVQKLICMVLASLQKEIPDKWISLKDLAREIYPDKDYSKIRSTISEYTNDLEDMGYVKKRRKRRYTYIISTKKNPYIGKKIIKRKIKVKPTQKKRKAKKKSK